MTDHDRIRPQDANVKLANKIDEIASRSWKGADARAIKQAAEILRGIPAAGMSVTIDEGIGWIGQTIRDHLKIEDWVEVDWIEECAEAIAQHMARRFPAGAEPDYAQHNREIVRLRRSLEIIHGLQDRSFAYPADLLAIAIREAREALAPFPSTNRTRP